MPGALNVAVAVAGVDIVAVGVDMVAVGVAMMVLSFAGLSAAGSLCMISRVMASMRR
jgi:hypothetical protein